MIHYIENEFEIVDLFKETFAAICEYLAKVSRFQELYPEDCHGG